MKQRPQFITLMNWWLGRRWKGDDIHTDRAHFQRTYSHSDWPRSVLLLTLLVCVCDMRLCTADRATLAATCLVISHWAGCPQSLREEGDKEGLWVGTTFAGLQEMWNRPMWIQISQPTVRHINIYRKTQRCCCWWVNTLIPLCSKNSLCPKYWANLEPCPGCFTWGIYPRHLKHLALMSKQFPLCSVSLCALLDNRLFSLYYGRLTCTLHRAGQSRVYSSSPACLLKLPDDTADVKQTFTAVTLQGSRMKVYENLASEKM